MSETSKSINSFTWKHGLVILMGLLVLVLLFLADNTNLDNDKGAALGDQTTEGATNQATSEGSAPGLMTDLIALLPADDAPQEVAQLRTALEAEQNPATREPLFQQIVEGYSQAGRMDLAAVYAAALASETHTARNAVVAAALFRNAAQLPHVAQDSSLFRRFSNEAMAQAEDALALEPQNEDAKLELGLAMVESGIPGNSMNGIFKIREVVEQNPKNTEALFHLGKFSLDTHQDDKAVQRFKQLLEVTPDDVRAKYYLGLAQQRVGNSAEFQRLMSEVAIQTQDANLAAMAKEALSRNP